MVRRRPPAYSCPFSFVLFFLIPFVRAQDPFDCHVEVGNVKYDLTALAGEHTLQRTRVTPPSTVIDTLRFDLCADLKPLDGVKEGDQCPTGTRACLTKTNRKQDETDRITVVIPMAQSASLKPNVSSLLSPKGLSIIMHGADYPSGSPIPHFLNVTLLCSPDDTGDPSFTEYHRGQAKVEWRVPAACASEGPSDDDRSGGGGGENKKEKSVGSGMGWFFLVLLLALAAYFGMGSYYNYTTYGATGVDLIPHRDFWKEVPYMLQDVISHLCSTVRPRHRDTRGGYIAV